MLKLIALDVNENFKLRKAATEGLHDQPALIDLYCRENWNISSARIWK